MGYETKAFIVECVSEREEYVTCLGGGRNAWKSVDGDGNKIIYYYDEEGKKVFISESDIIKKKYSQLIAMVDMCKTGNTSFRKKITDKYFFDFFDGNKVVVEDKYDDELYECSLDEFIEFLEEQLKEGEQYHRYVTALALAKSCKDLYINPTVLFYGY